ncbi:52 kDa repressor of the inhibitor of the protein kinase-like [Acropora millepora]|uniref:52 kDa repressor of the inhibitor of the protein kinase-like n=1 Tax=Acropora millepora TaxID=45264 RepID=UPI001CF30F9A|nr:52 kDa repressor of the inhibitor of the protein kinase-like [Acropora millepora]
MINSCCELYSFFDNSPKRQRFLDIVFDVLGKGETKQLKNLCKTRWIERHSMFETIYDLYEYVVTTLDEIYVPPEDERFECPGEESWDWDANTRILANGLRHTMKSFGHIFCFVCAMDMLEPMRPLVGALQGCLVEVYFGLKKVEEVINSYNDIRSGIDKWFERLCTKVLHLSELVGSAEERPRVNRRGTTPAETAKEYWKRAVAIPLLDIVSSELKSRLTHAKRANYELCPLVPEVISKKNENAVTSPLNVLKKKWEHILPLPAASESELFCWSNHWKRQEAMPDESVTSIMLLKILAVLPIGSTQAERSFSCLCRLHTWLRSTMTTDRLSDLSVIAMHSNTMVALEKDRICRAFMELHPRRLTEPSPLLFGQ